MKEKKEPELEEIFEELEDILNKMEDREVSLEESFLLYENGMKKLKMCNDKIDRVEKKMLVMTEQGEVTDFDS